MRNLIFIFTLLMLSACFWKPSAKKIHTQAISDSLKANQACMDSLKAFLKQNWFYHKEGNYYSYTPEFRREVGDACMSCPISPTKPVRFLRCLTLLDSAKTIELFGKPNQNHRKFLGYDLVLKGDEKYFEKIRTHSALMISFRDGSIGNIIILEAN